MPSLSQQSKKISSQKFNKPVRLAIVSVLASAAVVMGTTTPASAFTDSPGGGAVPPPAYTPHCLAWGFIGDFFLVNELKCLLWSPPLV